MENNKENKFVSVIIPCRNEENFIEDCVRSFLEQDYSLEDMEILVIDGKSKDNTIKIVEKLKEENKEVIIKIIDNDNIYTPFALNLGIRNSIGDIILIAGSHAVYETDYVSNCVKALEKHNADNVGGVLVSIPKEDGLIATGICLSLSSFFGAGNSAFRVGVEEAREVDTVFGGCYKREVFEKVGFFNENLIRSQDMEFNMRLKKADGKIMIVPNVLAYYYPKSNLFNFLIHNFKDGFWSIYPLKFVKMPFKIRHYIPLIFVLSLLLSWFFSFFNSLFAILLFNLIIVFYLLALTFFSIKIALRQRKIDYISAMFIVFAVRHFGYGFGSIWALIILIKEKIIKKNKH